jgi:hypothetical protein
VEEDILILNSVKEFCCVCGEADDVEDDLFICCFTNLNAGFVNVVD